ncbi:six-hairpin glycosidase-like protein [uncultured Dokdonia sp.]|uniref:six-hairpin glycosidase-like protein n=1 Tax=uncultured Dokdonia sp. TaxID=575653 RepID=UPI00261CBEBB|nr:six-hairpin glycosidase-like protein [uncultured Dokdonia sp.]
MKTFLYSLCMLCITTVVAQENTRWKIADSNIIQWTIENSNLPHSDNIEMAGTKVAGIVSYDVDAAGNLEIERQVFYPQLHPHIKESDPDWFVFRAYLKETYTDAVLPKFYINEKQFSPGALKEVTINGIITFVHTASKSGVTLSRKLYPSPNQRLFIEELHLVNTSNTPVTIAYEGISNTQTKQGIGGTFRYSVQSKGDEKTTLQPGASVTYQLHFTAQLNEEPTVVDDQSLEKRTRFLEEMQQNLILETPNPIFNQLFEFSKIRASESIFDSKLGLIHSPGGGRYYVGIWANDQAEYVSAFFPYLGYEVGNESAMNCYRAFDRVKSPTYEPIQYAFEVEERKPPALLDRGDAAMIAYGATQYALARGNQAEAEELWDLISWSLEYNDRNLTNEGVVKSQSDEMEGRIETGDANLSTSSLYYGALTNAVYLAKALNKPATLIEKYTKDATQLKIAIENYFGDTVEGLETYKYYKEHTTLRHWICLPLVVDINDRAEATTEALFDRLWTDNGVHVEKNNPDKKVSEIFWDRGTLYALRGVLRAGATEQSIERLAQFSKTRLLGERVPYVVEAFPEGGMAHLSAESGLYCRVFTEGLFGITPTGFDSFTIQPRLPKDWNEMALRHIRLFGKDFDIEIQRNGTRMNVLIKDATTGKLISKKKTKGDKPLSFTM